MTPIEKNIAVTDEFGNEYMSTYPKRAKGLVKQGRARFMDEGTICLLGACPPIKILEDPTMNIENTLTNQEIESLLDAVKDLTGGPRSNGPRPEAEADEDPILSRIDAIMHNNQHINEAISGIREMAETGAHGNEAHRYINGIVDVVRSREATNQKTLELLREMHSQAANLQKVDAPESNVTKNAIALTPVIRSLLENMPSLDAVAFTRELLGMDSN